MPLRLLEKELIINALQEHNGNMSLTAQFVTWWGIFLTNPEYFYKI